MKSEFCVTVLFKSEQKNRFFSGKIFTKKEIEEYTKFYSFDTKKELDAFILGLEEANGWLDLLYFEGLKLENNQLFLAKLE